MSAALLALGVMIGFPLAVGLLLFCVTRWPKRLTLPSSFWLWLFNEKEGK